MEFSYSSLFFFGTIRGKDVSFAVEGRLPLVMDRCYDSCDVCLEVILKSACCDSRWVFFSILKYEDIIILFTLLY